MLGVWVMALCWGGRVLLVVGGGVGVYGLVIYWGSKQSHSGVNLPLLN